VRPENTAANDAPVEILTPEALARVRSHPRFGEAMREAANGLTKLYEGNRVLNALINDRGRMAMGFLALYLHWTRRPAESNSGLTVSRLKAICVERKYSSAGRAEAMIALMRLFGYVEPAQNSEDRRQRLLVPTDKLVGIHLERWLCQFTAMAMVMEEGRCALEALKRPEFPPAFIRELCERHFEGLRVLDAAPQVELFVDRNAGTMIMFYLLTHAAPAASADQQPIRISISNLSRRFGVSRAHVRKLLNDAAAEGLLTRAGPEGEDVELTPVFTEVAENFFAATFVVLAHSVMSALAEIGEARAAA
jgi:hypothetical protein